LAGKHFIRLVLTVAALGLAACTSQEQIERQSAIPPYPEPYRAALQAELRMLAVRETERNDHMDAKRFMLRAEEAARAVTIWPHEVDGYDIPPGASRDALAASRERLILLFDGGRARAPKDLARAHAAYECWLEEVEEGHQPEDIAWCRERYQAAAKAVRYNAGLDADWGVVAEGEDGHVGAITLKSKDGGESLLDSADAAGFVNEGDDVRDASLTPKETTGIGGQAMALMPTVPSQYIIYFESGSAALDAEDRAILAEVAEDAKNRPAPDIELLGFADRAGDDRTNLALSERRIEAAPAVDTGDGVPEPRNRRVEITVR